MEEVLARAKAKAAEAELFIVSSEETPVHFEANRLKSIQTKQATTVSLRIIREGRIGHATTTRLETAADLVDMAVESARFGMVARFEFPPRLTYPEVEVFDPAVEAVSLQEMVGLGEELVSAVTGHAPGILCDGGASKATVTVRILNTRGGEASYRVTTAGLGIGGTLIRDTDMLFVGDSDSSCRPVRDTRKLLREVFWQLDLARELAVVASGTMPVIFTPRGVARALALPLMAAFHGKTVLEGASPVGGKVGQSVFDEKLSVSDDPTIPYRPASRPCDDEGVPSQRTPLIEKGKVVQFLYDLQTAGQAGTRSTGSGGRGRGLPSPSPSAFVIATGDTTFEQMVRDVPEGLVVDEVMGAGQGNVLGGEFSGNVLLGFRVRNGRIAGRVKNTMISGNIYQALRGIAGVGSEAQWVGGSLCTPHLYLPRVSVASR